MGQKSKLISIPLHTHAYILYIYIYIYKFICNADTMTVTRQVAPNHTHACGSRHFFLFFACVKVYAFSHYLLRAHPLPCLNPLLPSVPIWHCLAKQNVNFRRDHQKNFLCPSRL